MSDTVRRANSPTVVLVHGAFADGSSSNGVIRRLQAQGVQASAMANPLRGPLVRLRLRQSRSPKWDFDDATFDRTAASFDNTDHVDIVIHNYRWRLGLVEGEAEYAELEALLAEGPVISVTPEGDANGAPHPEPSAYAAKFSGEYAHRTIAGGVGHNLPQEAPAAFADAVLEVGGRGK
jgi:pimeloyl-ACP methyl ester carboxylesterase